MIKDIEIPEVKNVTLAVIRKIITGENHEWKVYLINNNNFPIENTLVARFAPKRFHHSAFGAKFVLTFGVGALAVKGVAAIETGYDIETVFICLAGAAAAALGFIGWLIAACGRYDAAGGRVAADTELPSTKA